MNASALAVRPDFHTVPKRRDTLGPEVGELGRLVGFAPYPEQQLLLDDTFGIGHDGRSSAFEVAGICARQNMKTGWLKLCALGWLFVTDEQLVVWSAHEFGTARQAFRDVCELIDGSEMLTRRIKQIRKGAGDESIETVTGQRLIFKARTSGGGRGLSGDKVILDEAFALQPEHMGALLPTLLARPDPQVLYGSSAGMEKSLILQGIRDRGRRGSARLAYSEWCAEETPCVDDACTHVVGVEGCALDRRELWLQANPVIARLDPDLEAIASLRRSLPPAEFARECLTWWDDPPMSTDEAFGPGMWSNCHTEDEPPAPVALGVAVSVDRAFASIAATGRLADERLYLGAVERRRGTRWVVAEAARICQEHGIPVVVDGKGPAADLIDDLIETGAQVITAGTSDVLDACADLFDAVQTERVAHGAHDQLEAAVGGAAKRPVGDRWAWGRRRSLTDVSMLEAATLAAWGASQTTDVWEAWT